MTKNIKYSVIVPAYSEAMVIESSLKALAKELKADTKRFLKTEVIVVTAESQDNTVELAKKQAKLFSYFNMVEPGKKVGKGRDVREGILAAKGEYMLFLDADMATPPHYIPNAFSILENNADIVIGIRPLTKIHNTFIRRLRSVVSNIMIQVLAVPGISDTQCGFKGFKADVAMQLFKPLETLAWGFDIEILARARVAKYKIAKIKIIDWFDPKIGKMNLVGESDIHADFKTLFELIAIFFKRLTGYYKKNQ